MKRLKKWQKGWLVGCFMLAVVAATVGMVLIPTSGSLQAKYDENLQKAQANLASEQARYSPESLGQGHSAKAALFDAEMQPAYFAQRLIFRCAMAEWEPMPLFHVVLRCPVRQNGHYVVKERAARHTVLLR